MEYRKHSLESYNIHTIKTDKYKTCRIEVTFKNKVIKEEYTERIFLSDIMFLSTKKYHNNQELSIEGENLYSPGLSVNVSINGNYIFTHYILNFINPKYTEEGMLEKTFDFLIEHIFNPDINNGEFNKKNYEIVKKMTYDNINSEKERIRNHAIINLFKAMDDKSPLSINPNGYLEDLEKITPKSLVKTYHNHIDNDYCDVFIYGDLDMNYIIELFKKKFPIKTIKVQELGPLYTKILGTKKVKNVVENMKIIQSIYTEGYTLNNLTDREIHYVMPMFTTLFGIGGTSKLFLKVREENSLCYGIRSYYIKYDQIMYIVTAIDSKSSSKVSALIKQSLKEMIQGNFSDEELENTKTVYLNSLETIDDSKSKIIDYYYFKDMGNKDDLETRIRTFKEITKEEIMNVAKKISLHSTYLVSDGGM